MNEKEIHILVVYNERYSHYFFVLNLVVSC